MCSLLHYSEEIQVKPNEDETFNWDLIQTVPACVINAINMISKIWYYVDFLDKCIYNIYQMQQLLEDFSKFSHK